MVLVDVWATPRGGFFLVAGDGRLLEAAELIDGGGSDLAAIAGESAGVDGVLRQEGVLIGAELGPDVVDVGHELAFELVDQVQEGMAVTKEPAMPRLLRENERTSAEPMV